MEDASHQSVRTSTQSYIPPLSRKHPNSVVHAPTRSCAPALALLLTLILPAVVCIALVVMPSGVIPPLPLLLPCCCCCSSCQCSCSRSVAPSCPPVFALALACPCSCSPLPARPACSHSLALAPSHLSAPALACTGPVARARAGPLACSRCCTRSCSRSGCCCHGHYCWALARRSCRSGWPPCLFSVLHPPLLPWPLLLLGLRVCVHPPFLPSICSFVPVVATLVLLVVATLMGHPMVSVSNTWLVYTL
jgi:hypothetical protein